MNSSEKPADVVETITWISVAEARQHPACRSAKPGKNRIDKATLYRWVARGRIRGWYRRPHLFVCCEDLDALMVPVSVEQRKSRSATSAQQVAAGRWTQQTLDKLLPGWNGGDGART